MLNYIVENLRILKQDDLKDGFFIIPSERSPRFVKALPKNRYPTCTPKARWIVVSFRLRRISLIAVPEFWLGQQLHLHDFFDLNEEAYRKLAEQFSYSDLIRFCGDAYHCNSCGHFVVSTLSIKRFAGYCRARL